MIIHYYLLAALTCLPQEGFDSWQGCRSQIFLIHFRLSRLFHLSDIHLCSRSTVNHPTRPVIWDQVFHLQ